MNTLEIRSSVRGHVSMIFWAGIWFIILLVLSRWMGGWIPTLDDRVDRHLLTGVTWVIYAVMVIITVSTLIATLYGPFRINSFYKNKDGNWHKVTDVVYSFPFSKNTRETVFDRIVQVEVNQSSIDRLLGTGDLILTLVTFTNADVVEKTWTISAIEHPYRHQGEIMSGSPKHDGLDVRLNPSRANT